MKTVILASSSPYRLQQLRQIGLSPTSIAPHINEEALPGEAPKQLAARLATEKALAVLNKLKQSGKQQNMHLVIAGDQTAELEQACLGKPGSHTNAIQQLEHCSGKTVLFHSAVCIANHKQQLQGAITTEVTFRKLSAAQIEYYITTEQPLDCAGSFKCEGLGITLFESIRSDDPSALIGLPLIKVTQMLNQLGYDVLSNN